MISQQYITALEAYLIANPGADPNVEPDVSAARKWTSFFGVQVNGEKLGPACPNVRTTAADWRSCLDWQSFLMGGSFNVGETGAATSVTATSLTNTGAAFPTTNNGYKGHIIVAMSDAGSKVYGSITNNTATVITVDRWYTPGSPAGAAGTTPAATCNYVILPGQAPAWIFALGETSAGSAAGDTTLANEVVADGLQRAMWTTFAHTSGATSYALSKTFTATATHTIYRVALFNAYSSGAMPFESDLSPIAVLASTDQMTVTDTISI